MKRKLLVIDDDTNLLEVLQAALERAGYWVKACAEGARAALVAREFHPDLVLCDINMPGMDGYAVLESFRQDTVLLEVPFLFLTARDTVPDMRKGMEGGADDYLSKTLPTAQVVRAIETRLALAEARRAALASRAADLAVSDQDLARIGLSPRESEVMRWVMEGKTNEEVGVILGITRTTVRTHLQNVFPKLGVENRLAAVQAIRRTVSQGAAAASSGAAKSSKTR